MMILLAGAAGAYVAYEHFGIGRRSPAALRYMPDGTNMFVSADMEAIRRSDVYDKLKKEVGKDFDMVDDFLKKEIGIKSSNIVRVSLGFDSDSGDRGRKPEAIVVVHLDIPLETSMVPEKLKKEEAGDFTFYKLGDGRGAMYIANKQTLVFGEPELLQSTLERNDMPKLPDAMKKALRRVDTSATIYVAAVPPDKIPRGPGNLAELKDVVEEIEAFTLSATITDDLTVVVQAICKKKETAEEVEEQLSDLVSKVRRTDGLPPEFKKLLGAIEITRSGTIVKAEATGASDKVVYALFLPAVQAARESARRTACSAHLTAIGRGVAGYRSRHNDQYPPDLEKLVTEKLIEASELRCPSNEKKAGATDYVYAPPDGKSPPPDTILACDADVCHPGTRNILRADGSVAARPEFEFQQELQRPQNRALAAALLKR